MTLKLKKLFRRESNNKIDLEVTWKHNQNEYDVYSLTDKEKQEEEDYQRKFNGFTHCTRNRLLA